MRDSRSWAQTQVRTHSDQFPALDGLRALAILLVFFFHLWSVGDFRGPRAAVLHQPLAFAFTGVLLFFVLSGFLLFLPYARTLLGPDAGHWPSARSFYARRARRILPLHLWALVLFASAWLILYPEVRTPWFYRGLGLTAVLAQNLSLDGVHVVSIVDGPLWTLALEWQFYLLLPWLALGMARVARGRLGRLAVLLLLLMAAGLALRAAAAFAHYALGFAVPMAAPGPLGAVLTIVSGYDGRFLEVFAVGMLLALLYVSLGERRDVRLPVWRGWAHSVAPLALALLTLCMLWAHASGVFALQDVWQYPATAANDSALAWLWPVLGPWLTSLGFAALLWATLTGPGPLRRFLAFPPLRFVGVISYSVYIWHAPIIHTVGSIPAVIGSTLVLSTLTYAVVERPFLRRRAAHRDTVATASSDLPALSAG